MGKNQEYVIKLNETTDMYMLNPFSPVYEENTWGAITHPNLLTRLTLEEVEAMAFAINAGTVGTPK